MKAAVQWLRREASGWIDDLWDEHPALAWMLSVGTISFLVGCLAAFVVGCMAAPFIFLFWLMG